MKLKIIQPQRCRIEMMPLIDSFFLILMYFIYSFLSMSAHQGISLELPQATTATRDKADHVAVSVDQDGKLFLNQQAIRREDLGNQLKQYYENNPAAFNLYIVGDTRAPHGAVVSVLNTARTLGIKKVLIETSPNADKNEP